MTSTLRNGALRPFAFFGMLLILTVCGSIDSRAQIFQAISGGGAEDAARGGVLYDPFSPFPPGFMSVGESNSFGTNYDIYVVRTDLAGNIQWAATYDIGGYDFGRKIARTADSNFVITGLTQDSTNCCTEANVFLLKIDAFGNAVWARTFGGRLKDEGRDVKVTKEPWGTGSREVYYVAGWSGSFSSGKLDGYLIKTDDQGILQWARVYGDGGVNLFNSCFVANDGTGEIIAAGATSSYTNTYDVWLVRVNPNDGSLVWSTYYGGQGTDIANSVIQLRGGFNPTNIIVAGYTTSLTNTQDALLLRTDAFGVFQAAEVVDAGPTGAVNAEEFFEVVEIGPTPSSVIMGDLLVCGRFYNNPTGLGRYDGYLGEYFSFLTAGAVWQMLYGGQRDEGLWGVDVAPGNIPNSPPYTAISVGSTSSFAFFGGIDDEYWVRANRGGKSGCNERKPTTVEYYPFWPENYVKPCHPMINVWCKAPIVYTYNFNMGFLCWLPGAIHQGDDPTKQDNTFDPTTGRDPRFGTAEVEAPTAKNETVTMMPNPVRAGSTFDIAIARPIGTTLTITVTDVKGSQVLAKELVSHGDGRVTIPTEGWTSGAYMVTISDGAKTETTKLVVTE